MRLMRATCTVLALLVLSMEARGQTAPGTDPIRCWWRTSAGAVAVGAPFHASLTCAAREQESIRAVVDESRLAAAIIQLTPFEVLDGTHPPDLQTATHRFFQYHYTIRIIDRDAIGRDTKFPELHIPYRVHTLANGEWQAGRDRTYIIPSHAMRVLSLVPAEADDIRDGSDESFARIAALRFRARAFGLAATALAVLALVVAVPGAVALVRQRRHASSPVEARASRRAILSAADSELARLEREARTGWTSEQAAAALSAVRVAAASALRRHVAQRSLAPGEASAGVVVAHGWRPRRRLACSSAVTSVDVARALDGAPPRERDHLQRLHDALERLTAAVYGSDAAEARASLGDVVESVRRVIRQLRWAR
jgi:hypothetical protein